MKHLIYILILVFIAWYPFQSLAAGKNIAEKRSRLRAAIEKGVLSPYDIEFPTYVNLEMWDEIADICDHNLNHVLRYTLPAAYLSRPYSAGDAFVVFNVNSPGPAYRFSKTSLEMIDTLTDYPFDRSGNVRLMHGRYILAGGGNRDVDAVTVYDMVTGESTILDLMAGHYVQSLLVENDLMLAGTCGETVNIWSLGDFRFIGSCADGVEGETDWESFNRKDCISSMHVYNDQVIGAGQTRLYFWDLASGALVRTLPKHIHGSETLLFEDLWIEYKDHRMIIQSVNGGFGPLKAEAPLPIADLVVTRSRLLPDQPKGMVIVSLRRNRGILFYDLATLAPFRRTDFKGQKLCIDAPYLLATDDHHLYRYALKDQNPTGFTAFMETVSIDEIPMDSENYHKMLEIARTFPQVMHPNDLAEKYLSEFGIHLTHHVYYGKIGERQVENVPEALKLTEEVYGYKMDLEMENTSDDGYRIPVRMEWIGRVGVPDHDVSLSVYSTEEEVTIHSGERFRKKEIILGEREPAAVFVYPAAIFPLKNDG